MLFAWLTAKGLFGLSKWIWALIAIAGAVLLAWAAIDAIGDAREAEIIAQRTADALEAERRATANDKPREDAREAESAATTEELEKIHAEDPEAAARPASRGSRAVADRLRPRSTER